MKICYHSESGINHYINVNFIFYLKKLMSLDIKARKRWSEKEFSLINNKNEIIWTKKIEDINEENLKNE